MSLGGTGFGQQKATENGGFFVAIEITTRQVVAVSQAVGGHRRPSKGEGREVRGRGVTGQARRVRPAGQAAED